MNKELQIGIEVEKEHGDDIDLATIIAKTHLKEDPNYYSKLMAAGLADEPEAQKIAQQDRAVSGQEGSVTLSNPIKPGIVNPSEPAKLSSSGLGVGSPNLKSSEMSYSLGSNTVANGKTPPKTPEPSVEVNGDLVNKTTGAETPHSVTITPTKPIENGVSGLSNSEEVDVVVSPEVDGDDAIGHFFDTLDIDIDEAVNYLGEKEFQTFAGWRQYIRSRYPGFKLDGDKDIASAFTADGKGIGEWDGATGCIYHNAPAPTVHEGESQLKKKRL